jgi:hypothetical protein
MTQQIVMENSFPNKLQKHIKNYVTALNEKQLAELFSCQLLIVASYSGKLPMRSSIGK